MAAGVADWAEEGNTDDIPADKLGNVPDAGLDTAAVDARIKDFARTGGRSIQTGDIGNVQITNQKIAGATLDNRVMANDAIDTDNIQDDAVTQAKIADNAVGADQIATGAVGGTEIAPDSVGTSELANNAVTNIKMADDSVGSAEIQANAVGSSEIANNAVGQSEIAANAVGSSEIQTNAVRANEIANNTIVDGNLSAATRGRLLPAGGADNQVLKKASGTDYDVEWAADEAGTGGGGSSTLVGLTDTPSALGSAGEVLAVATGGTATEWVGQAMAGLDVETFLAYRTYASSPTGGQRSAAVTLDADYATGNSFIYIIAGGNANSEGMGFIPISRLTAATSTNENVGVCEVAGFGPMFVDFTSSTRSLTVRSFNTGHQPRIQAIFFIRSAAATGSGLSQSQVDARVRAIVEDWAEVSNAATIPSAKLASGGTDGQVLTRTATGQAWEAASGGLDQAAVDARVQAGVKDFAETGGRQIQSGDIGTGQVGSAQIADATIVSGDIASDAITGANIAPNAIGASELANNAVDSGAIANNAVTAAKIAANAVGASELADNAVDSGAIANLAVTEAKLASNAVSERTIQNDAVRAAQIQAGAVGSSELANNAVTSAKINTDAVGSSEIAAGAVGTSELANNAVTPAQVHSTLASRLVPAGGTDNQILAKSADADYATEWIDAPSGGTGGTPTPLVVTALESSFTPSLAATNVAAIGETQINIAAGTIASAHPFSVSNNGIVVAAGTTSFQATFDVVVEVDPTGYVNNATAGGNRLFFDIYLKKDGVIIPASRTSQYMRAHEGWAATIHKAHLTFTDALSPGTYTLWFYRGVAAGSGNEVNAIQIASANSTIVINSETYGGQPAPGSGLTQAQTDARVTALVADFAEQGNASLIPVTKLASGGTTGQVLTRTATAQEWAAQPEGSKFFVKRAYSTTGTQRTLAISATEDGVTWSDYHAITLTFSVGSVEYNTTIPIGGLSVRTGLSTYVIVDEYFEWSGTNRTLRARNLNGLIRAAYLIRY